MADVRFREVSKVFDGGVVAVDSLTHAVADGEFMVLVGPSGCGKTTALRMVAGLEKPTSGWIEIGGVVVNDVPPKARDIAMVFQNYALYPHMSVEKNIAFGLQMHGFPRSEIAGRVREVSAMLDLDDLLRRKPAQLSGGQRQRVAMGRALARHPKVFLLDEPLSNLDAKLRAQLRADLKQLHHAVRTTSIYVTHDQVEAMTLGERIAVMSKGVLQQVGTPHEVYDRPANLFVAGFIGAPPMNLLEAQRSDGVLRAGELVVTDVPAVETGRPVVGLRPESLRLRAGDALDVPSFRFTADVVEPLGHEVIVHGRIAGHVGAPVVARLAAHIEPRPGEVLELTFGARDVHLFDGETGERLEQ
ncbi:MAG: sn-glycerol-3-phosphate ABC transporter ATP-binding protein UgpC [Gaiellales bacterium]